MLLPRTAPAFTLIAALSTMLPAYADTPVADTQNTTLSTEEPSPAAGAPQPGEAQAGTGQVPKARPVPLRIISIPAQGERRPDSLLRIVEPSNKTLDIGLMVIGAFLGSFRLPVDKDYYEGTKVDDLWHPAVSELPENIRQAVAGWQEENGMASTYENPINLRPDTFALVYTEYQTDQPTYDLLIQTTATRKPDSAGWFSTGVSVVCSDRFDAAPLTREQWAADGYAAVKEKGRKHVANCMDKLRPAFSQMFAQ